MRISREAKEKGIRIRHLADAIYAWIHERYSGIVDKVEVHLYTEEATVTSLLKEAISLYREREERLASITDESVERFYSCLYCRPFMPHHVCIITPERPGLCGRYSWLEAKANHQLEPMGINRPVRKGEPIDEVKGERLPMANGVMVVNREYRGVTPLDEMRFSALVSRFVLDGRQIPGVIAHSKGYILSRKYISADGGFRRIVWMPKMLKDEIGSSLNVRARSEGIVERLTKSAT